MTVLDPLASLTAALVTAFLGSPEEEAEGREELDEDEEPADRAELEEEDVGGLEDDEEEDPEGLDDDEVEGLPATAALSRSLSACARACSEEEDENPELEVRACDDEVPEGPAEDDDVLTVGISGSALAFSS